MCALPRATVVTTVYQRDSSSKRPRSFVVFPARTLPRVAGRMSDEEPGLHGFAACGRRLRAPADRALLI